MQVTSSPFQLPAVTPFRIVERVAERVTGLRYLDSLYQKRPMDLDCFEFMDYTLQALNIDYNVQQGSLNSIPEEGPVVIVANHPLGAIEGVILAALVRHRRPDVKVMANELLKQLPELSDLFIGVDVFESKSAIKTNLTAMRSAHQHLANGGALIIFPAGEVSTYQDAQLQDKTWSRSVAKLVKKSKATCVPIYIEGKNSSLFYLAGKIHPLLRTAMLGREMIGKRSSQIQLSIGEPILYSEMKSLNSEQDLVHYLRLNTYLLRKQSGQSKSLQLASFSTPVMDAIDSERLQDEVNALPSECLLLSQGDFSVYCARKTQIPNLILEIGRVREANFRDVGEGTGKALDLDHYDEYYDHLFIWHSKDKQLVGSYRLGKVDEILQQHGLKGLYSRSLFNYSQSFVESLDHSIELGRSVVNKPYQRNLQSLLMLWKGIASYVYRNPKYTHLYGPVSISNDYSQIARQLMASCLSIHHYDEHKANLVSPSVPLKKDESVFWRNDMLSALGSVQLLSKVLSRMEEGKGLPVLLRQYLGLNGQLVCFNVDPEFNDALDGLIVVDLRNVPERTLGKYMGKEEAKTYLCHHP
ncbi:lysophospholipid acyltransferase family protein [Vibrio penaeicida]|uniref:L-ornithine N(alpha)-acyltransferase n=1 Tax=Vibrio penaeicida TaxID=104609 RepID=A0AAV5NS82_9VIBR|nr:GNAT family N-acyltransferase [Vibrio penaeicida]RTZ25117.1 lysophospholipid acyltransferase family protein [Vibrio penaeicida]GLQ73389.1 hemolysin [Vibrio penaeicida]